MGKEKIAKNKNRHVPLGQQILASDGPRQVPRQKARDKQDEPSAEDHYVGSKLSQNILQQAREQQDEDSQPASAATTPTSSVKKTKPSLFSKKIVSAPTDSDNDNADGDDLEDEDGMKPGDQATEDAEQDSFFQQLNIDPEDERTLRLFMAPQTKTRSLGDIIMSKIKEKETELASQMSERQDMPALDPKIIRVYKSVGQILSRYRSGKLPKAFKILPSLRNWEEILYVTEPDQWTAASMFQATRIFASNLNQKMAQRFFNLILLPRVRDDIMEYKRLNFHLYMALKKALFKSSAFFKGILLPLCEAGDCSLREAVIIGSVLSRVSIPVLHSSAALLKIAEMPYTGANSIFLRVMLDKKYALPYRVIDALVFHFYRFESDKRPLPVLWHQCLLVFVERYKEDITTEQKQFLLDVTKVHKHPDITSQIQREIILSKSRDSAVSMKEEMMVD